MEEKEQNALEMGKEKTKAHETKAEEKSWRTIMPLSSQNLWANVVKDGFLNTPIK